MRLPDPFTPNLKVDLLAEISQAPIIMSNYAQALNESGLMADVELYLQSGQPAGFLHSLKDRLVANAGYNVPLINSLVLHVGVKAIAQLNKKQGNSSMQHSAPMVSCYSRTTLLMANPEPRVSSTTLPQSWMQKGDTCS